MTAIGGEAITGAIEDSAALLGYEASRTEPPAGNVEFVDYPFNSDETTGDRIDLLEAAVRKHQPRLAVGPDIEGLDNVAIAWADRRGTPRPAPEIVTGEQLASRGVDPDAIDAEVRRRNAGRGPPVADPDTGEIDEAIDVRGTTLNAHDERVTAALERLAESDRPESVAVDVDPIEELDDEQETLQL